MSWHVGACCWHPVDHNYASEDSVQDARQVTRSQAHHRFAYSDYEWTEVGVWKRYIRPLSRQAGYEWWVESSSEGWDGHPDVAPAEWDQDAWYGEDMPYWEFCRPDDPGAVPVWICGLRADGPPASLPPRLAA